MMRLLDGMEALVRQAGEIARQKAPKVHEKACHDYVTEADLKVSQFLCQRLPELVPGSGVYSEEGADEDCRHGKWFVVDPIDGTTNFTRRMNYSNISVALVHQGQAEYGVVYNPYVDELYAARRGQGATLNGVPIRVSDNDLRHGLVICGSTIYDRRYTAQHFAILGQLYERCMDYRRFAAAALDCCQVAAGRAELFFECRLSPWDYAAGALIAQEAGGIATRLDGTPLDPLRPGSVFIANPRCHAVLRELEFPPVEL